MLLKSSLFNTELREVEERYLRILADAESGDVVAADEVHLSETGGSPVLTQGRPKMSIIEDASAINALIRCTELSKSIKKQQLAAHQMKYLLHESRNKFAEVARFASTIYFCCQRMLSVNHLYRLSLNMYRSLHVNSLRKAGPPSAKAYTMPQGIRQVPPACERPTNRRPLLKQRRDCGSGNDSLTSIACSSTRFTDPRREVCSHLMQSCFPCCW